MDALINPATRDYELLSGVVKRDPSGGLANTCYQRLSIPLGSYWADKSIGSRLHELQREKDVVRVSTLAKQYAQQALAPIVTDGRATQIDISTEQLHNGRIHLLFEVTTASGETLTFKHPVGVI
ncbi:MAG: phage GP46 family protein [Sideroxydans sp.]